MDQNNHNINHDIRIPEIPDSPTPEKKKSWLPLAIILSALGILIVATAVTMTVLLLPLMKTTHFENTVNAILFDTEELEAFSEAIGEGAKTTISLKLDSEVIGLIKDLRLEFSVASKLYEDKEKGAITLSIGGNTSSLVLSILYDEETAALGIYELAGGAAKDSVSYVSLPRKGITEEFKSSVFAPGSGTAYSLDKETFDEVISALEAFEKADNAGDTESIRASFESISLKIIDLIETKSSVRFADSGFALCRETYFTITDADLRAIIEIIIAEAEANDDFAALLDSANIASDDVSSAIELLRAAADEIPKGKVCFSYTVSGDYVRNIKYTYIAPDDSDDGFVASLDFLYDNEIGFDILVSYDNGEEEKVSYRKSETDTATTLSIVIEADGEIFEAKSVHNTSAGALLISAGMRGDRDSVFELRGNCRYNSDKAELKFTVNSIKLGNAKALQGFTVEMSLGKNSDDISIPYSVPILDMTENELTSFIKGLPIAALNNIVVEYTGYGINSYMSVDGKFIPHLPTCVSIAAQYATLYSKYLVSEEKVIVPSVYFPSADLGLNILLDYSKQDNMIYYNFAYEMSDELLEKYHIGTISESGKLIVHDLQYKGTKDPTCSANGYTEYFCNICNKSVYLPIDKTEHVNLMVDRQIVFDDGNTYDVTLQMCASCGEFHIYEIVGIGRVSFDKDESSDGYTIETYKMYGKSELDLYYGIPIEIEEMLNITSISATNKINNVLCVRIPKGVAEIRKGAFRNADNLQVLILPSSIKTIDSFAFSNSLVDLHTVFFCGTEAEWKAVELGDLENVIDTVNIIFCPNGVTSDMLSEVIFEEDKLQQALAAAKDAVMQSNAPAKEAAEQDNVTLLYDGKIEQLIYDDTGSFAAVCCILDDGSTQLYIYDTKTATLSTTLTLAGKVAHLDMRDGYIAYAYEGSFDINVYEITTAKTSTFTAQIYYEFEGDSLSGVHIHEGKVYTSTVIQHCYITYYDIVTAKTNTFKFTSISPEIHINHDQNKMIVFEFSGSPESVTVYDLDTNQQILTFWLEKFSTTATYMGDYLIDNRGNLYDLEGNRLTSYPEGSTAPIPTPKLSKKMAIETVYSNSDGNLTLFVEQGYVISSVITNASSASPISLDIYIETAIVTDSGDFLVYTPGGYGLLLIDTN